MRCFMAQTIKYLCDTHILIWLMDDSPQLGPETRRILLEEDVKISLVSVWEIAIESSLGKLNITDNLKRAIGEAGFTILDISLDHVVHVQDLAWHHRDPFDRLLISQAICDGLVLITHDRKLNHYGARLHESAL